MDQDEDKIPMERLAYEGGTGPRFTLLVFTKVTHQLLRKYGGDPVALGMTRIGYSVSR